MQVKKGDNVIVLTGKDKGKKGKIVKSIPKENAVVVEGLNIWKKTQRPKKRGEKGQMISIPMPIDASNVKKI